MYIRHKKTQSKQTPFPSGSVELQLSFYRTSAHVQCIPDNIHYGKEDISFSVEAILVFWKIKLWMEWTKFLCCLKYLSLTEQCQIFKTHCEFYCFFKVEVHVLHIACVFNISLSMLSAHFPPNLWRIPALYKCNSI